MHRARFASILLLGLFTAFVTPTTGAETVTTPEPLKTEFVYEAIVEIAPDVDVGTAPQGHRRYVPITGGTFEGAGLKGIILPGGADWQTERPDGVLAVDALYSMRCDDGTVIIVHNSGTVTGNYARTTTHFEVKAGAHDWLNKFQFAGSVSAGPRPGTVTIRVFKLL
jgi:hypothetical protein